MERTSKKPSARAAGGRRRPSAKEKTAVVPICHFFQKGTCRAGATCRFQHPADDDSTLIMDAGASAFVPRQQEQTSLQPRGSLHSKNTTNGSTLVDNYSQASSNKPAAPTRNYARKEFCPYKAEAILRAKVAQDNEARPWWQQQQVVDQGTMDPNNIAGKDDDENQLLYGMDVECVATGYGHGLGPNHRRPVRVALVDSQ
eukprot:scaffold482681_cov63-Attheya_sp.AAC.1